MEWPLLGRESDLKNGLELVRRGVGMAILGSAGVGKSRLLHEIAAGAEAAGHSVVNAVATASTKTIPFAPFVELLPDEPSGDRLAGLRAALSSLHAQSTGRGLLLAIDDAHHLDISSLALVALAVSSEAATVCMTVRTGERMESDLVDLWTNGAIERVDLSPLTRLGMEHLVNKVLGDIDPGVSDELWRLSQGNPLVLHELVEGALGSGLERNDDGIWHQTGPLAKSARLADLVGSRVNSLPESIVPAMEIVAVGAPLPLPLATNACGSALEELEAMGLVQVVQHGDARAVMPAHPMYGEILVENLPETRRSRALSRLAEVAASHRNDVDPIRAAVWQSESGQIHSVELALAGALASLNRHDPGLAENLVRPLGVDDPRAVLILGRALSYQKRPDEAEAVLAGVRDVPDEMATDLASVRAQNLAFGLHEIGKGREILEAAAAVERDPESRARLNNERAMLSSIMGDFDDARAATAAVLIDSKTGEVARVAAYVTLSVAQAMAGDSTGLDEILPVALPMSERVHESLPFARDQIAIMEMAGCLNAGRIDDALESAERAIAQSRGDALLATWLSAAFLALDAAGLPTTAADHARRALDVYRRADPFGLANQARGELALSRAQLGVRNADDVIRDLSVHDGPPRISVWVDRGKAWAMVVRDETELAVDVLIGGGRHAEESEHFAWACQCFHDVVRLGRPELVLESLEALPEMPGSRLLHTMIDHGRAVASGEQAAVEDVASRFTEMKARLLAAEAWAQLAGLLVDESAVGRAALLSVAMESLCEDAVTPALSNRPSVISVREADVALAAASGATSVEIADARFVSPRTVENHLQSVYRKGAIGGRDELRDLLTPVLTARVPSTLNTSQAAME